MSLRKSAAREYEKHLIQLALARPARNVQDAAIANRELELAVSYADARYEKLLLAQAARAIQARKEVACEKP